MNASATSTDTATDTDTDTSAYHLDASATFDTDIAALFDLDPRSIPLADLSAVPNSGDCTNDGCTASCVSCGCR